MRRGFAGGGLSGVEARRHDWKIGELDAVALELALLGLAIELACHVEVPVTDSAGTLAGFDCF